MTESERSRFHELRTRYLHDEMLTGEEQAELIALTALVEREERDRLSASRTAQEGRIAALDARIAELQSLVARREALARYLKRVQKRVDAERAEIDRDYQRFVAASSKSLAAASRD